MAKVCSTGTSKGKELNDKKIEIKLKQFLSYRGFNFFQIENAIETFNRNEMVDGQS